MVYCCVRIKRTGGSSSPHALLALPVRRDSLFNRALFRATLNLGRRTCVDFQPCRVRGDAWLQRHLSSILGRYFLTGEHRHIGSPVVYRHGVFLVEQPTVLVSRCQRTGLPDSSYGAHGPCTARPRLPVERAWAAIKNNLGWGRAGSLLCGRGHLRTGRCSPTREHRGGKRGNPASASVFALG